MMLDLAAEYPEYRETAKKVKLVDTSSGAYYGKGYQDVQNRVPKIEGTMTDLNSSGYTQLGQAGQHGQKFR